jgi:ABC-type lipoprotein export system ATPase subunit
LALPIADRNARERAPRDCARARHAAGLLLADEPTGNLDSKTGQAIPDLLGGLNADDRLTVVLVTHSSRCGGVRAPHVELRDGCAQWQDAREKQSEVMG